MYGSLTGFASHVHCTILEMPYTLVVHTTFTIRLTHIHCVAHGEWITVRVWKMEKGERGTIVEVYTRDTINAYAT
jgi:uncharacterized membrane protein YagU involved in acid resistance